MRRGDEPRIDLDRPFPTSRRAMAPLAVLTGSRTCSGGEAVVVAIAGRAQARRFGQPIDELSTANRTHAVHDGAALFLTTSVSVDRDGIAPGHRIAPDESVTTSPMSATSKCFGEATDGSRPVIDAGNGDTGSLTLTVDADGAISAYAVPVDSSVQIPCSALPSAQAETSLDCQLDRGGPHGL